MEYFPVFLRNFSKHHLSIEHLGTEIAFQEYLWKASSNGCSSKTENSPQLFVNIYVGSGFEYAMFPNKFRQIIFKKYCWLIVL